MGISFDLIPTNLRTPGSYTEFNNSRAAEGAGLQPQIGLIIAQRLSTGTVAEAVPTLVQSAVTEADGFFGRGSVMARMLKHYAKTNKYSELWAIALDDDAGGTAATGTIAFSGTATANGTLYLYVAGHRVTVAVTKDDDQDAVCAAAVAAINAKTEIEATAAVDGTNANECDITARHKGTVGNDIDIRFNYYQGEAYPAGISATVTPMAGGATDPDIADAIAVIADTHYNTIATHLDDASSLSALDTLLDSRWDPTVQKEAQAFVGICDTLANTTTFGNSLNSKFITIAGPGDSPSPSYLWAAGVASMSAFEAGQDPARPLQTLKLPYLLPAAEADRFTRDERNTLLYDGVSTFTVDASGSARVERLITTYQTNAVGAVDASYLNLNTLRTLAFLRWDWNRHIATKYPRHKLADDGNDFAPGQSIVTPSTLRAEAFAIFKDRWQYQLGLVENFDQFKEDLIVERDGTDPDRVNLRMTPDLMNQFRVLANQIQFLL